MKIKSLYVYLIGGLVLLAVLLYVSNNTEDKISQTNSVTQGQMPNDDVHKGMGNSGDPNAPSGSNVMGSFKDQLDKYEKEYNDNPTDTLIMRNYAELLSASHKPEKAIEIYNEIIKVDSKRIDILLALTFNYYNMGNLDKALELTNRALEINPETLEAKYNQGAIAAAKGDKDAAKKYWNDLIKDYPNSKAADFASKAIVNL